MVKTTRKLLKTNLGGPGGLAVPAPLVTPVVKRHENHLIWTLVCFN
jgi:hypothetical protein